MVILAQSHWTKYSLMSEIFEKSLRDSSLKIENVLSKILDKKERKNKILNDAMRYSVLEGGKRIRPFLAVECSKFFDIDEDEIMQIAAAIELLHAYSLVHDDLPSLDNDDLRRGKPSTHKYFDEAIAVLVGDALQALSFEILSDNYKKIKKIDQINLINSFAKYVGQDGMVGGQAIDISKNQNNLSIENLLEMYKLKTANLISFSCQIGGIVSGAEQKKVNALKNFGDNLGIAFQISDDILDIIGDEKITGKRVGSDLKNKKKTFLNFFDIDESKMEVKKYCDLSISSLKIFGPVPETLLGLVNFIKEREF